MTKRLALLAALLAVSAVACQSERGAYVDYVRLPCKGDWRMVSVVARQDTVTVVVTCVQKQ